MATPLDIPAEPAAVLAELRALTPGCRGEVRHYAFGGGSAPVASRDVLAAGRSGG